MRSISELQIEQPVVSIFASGNSIHDLSKEELEFIRSRSFTVTLNYAPIRLDSHLNVWSDKLVTEWMETHYQNRPKDRLFLVRDTAFAGYTSTLKPEVDYWFSLRADQLKGNYTIVWLLQLMERFFSKHRFLVFGLDFYTENTDQAKWYDQFTDHDREGRNRQSIERKLNRCISQLDHFVSNKTLFFNCNPKSRYPSFQMANWKEVLG
ncbi:MAG: hypothetical protein ACFB10_25320 [Salibacteraceae bacterium]